MKTDVKKLALSGILVAVAVVGSTFSFPVGVAKCAPVQHMVNVLAGVLLGPWYAVGVAFVTSCIRVVSGTGTLLHSLEACVVLYFADYYTENSIIQ